MFEATVIQILIGGPDDTKAERDTHSTFFSHGIL